METMTISLRDAAYQLQGKSDGPHVMVCTDGVNWRWGPGPVQAVLGRSIVVPATDEWRAFAESMPPDSRELIAKMHEVYGRAPR